MNISNDIKINDNSDSDDFIDVTSESNETIKLLSEIKNTYKNKQQKINYIHNHTMKKEDNYYDSTSLLLSKRNKDKQNLTSSPQIDSDSDSEDDSDSYKYGHDYEDEDEDIDFTELLEDIKTDLKNGYAFAKESMYVFSISFKSDCNELISDVQSFLKQHFDIDFPKRDNDKDNNKDIDINNDKQETNLSDNNIEEF